MEKMINQIIAIVQARVGSKRLRGKIFMNLNDKPLIWWVISRLKKVKELDNIIVATTKKKEDDKLVKWLKKNKVNYFRGSSKNVLLRYYECAKKFQAKIIVRITADDPLKDSALISKCIKILKKKKLDYISNTLKPTYPIGLDIEVLSIETLNFLNNVAKTDFDREHVTQYLIRNQNKFKVINIENSENLSKLRLTIDTKKDYLNLKKFFKFYIKNQNINLKKLINSTKNFYK
jgi:spore coat polysaccharide biosynthesis protein SpsF